MGLFGKHFSKQENTPEKPKEEKIYFDDDYCRFGYFASPKSGEYGYEGNIELENPKNNVDELTIYIDTDSPETTDAGKCYARFKY